MYVQMMEAMVFREMVTTAIEDLAAKAEQPYDVCVAIGPNDHDEIRMSAYQKAEYSDHRFHEPNHGRRNRYVWCMPSAGW